MDFNIVSLEIADHIAHFDYYDNLISARGSKDTGFDEEQTKIRNKSQEHLAEFFAGTKFYNAKKQILPLSQMSSLITSKLEGTKPKDIHALVEKLEKDAKKIKKLYKALAEK